MYHPTTRLLTILELLQAHPSLSGDALARRLEVEPRSVRRYITMLQDMGMPIEAVRGHVGGDSLLAEPYCEGHPLRGRHRRQLFALCLRHGVSHSAVHVASIREGTKQGRGAADSSSGRRASFERAPGACAGHARLHGLACRYVESAPAEVAHSNEALRPPRRRPHRTNQVRGAVARPP